MPGEGEQLEVAGVADQEDGRAGLAQLTVQQCTGRAHLEQDQGGQAQLGRNLHSH